MLKNKLQKNIFLLCLGLICLIFVGCVPQPVPIENESEAPGSFSFIFMGDSQADPEIGDYTAWGQMLKKAAAEKSQPVFVLISGDMVNDGDDQSEWNRFLTSGEDVWQNLHLNPAVGNHDDTDLFRKIFNLPENGPENYKDFFYSFDYGNAHFTVMDSNAMESAKPVLADWLKKDLSNTDAAYKFVMFHHPVYSAMADPKDTDLADTIKDIFVPVMEEGGVDFVLNGHQHVYMRTFPIYNGSVDDKGIVYLMGNSAGKFYEPGKYDYAASIIGNQPVYTVFTVTAEGIKLETKNSSGDVLDTYYMKNEHISQK